MDMRDLIGPGNIYLGLGSSSKTQLLKDLSRLAAEPTHCPAASITVALNERERLGSTGMGGGFALPHARLPHLDRPFGLVATLEHPCDFEAVDDLPVDLVFLLLVPQTENTEHLKLLAQVVRLFRDRQTARTLRQCGSADELCRAICTSDLAAMPCRREFSG